MGSRNRPSLRGLSPCVYDLCTSPAGDVMPTERLRNGARRPYHGSGARAVPQILARIVATSVPEGALSPVEQAARTWCE